MGQTCHQQEARQLGPLLCP